MRDRLLTTAEEDADRKQYIKLLIRRTRQFTRYQNLLQAEADEVNNDKNAQVWGRP